MGITNSNYKFGSLPSGNRNLITDVPGVKVGHVTLSNNDIQTGVTAIIPGPGSAFQEKFPAAMHVINGFGKSVGLMQIEELGTLETPILFTNTLSVSACLDGLITYMLKDHPEIGTTTGTVNPVIGECNDSFVNDIRGRHVTADHALDALANASEDFEEGAIGAGRGMKCFGWSGGIGSASRIIELGEKKYTVGSLLLTNFGQKNQFTICGKKAEEFLNKSDDNFSTNNGVINETQYFNRDMGSCMIIIATDVPLSSRQLKRCARRAQNGLARCGGQTSGGSGEIAIAFSTANRIPHDSTEIIHSSTYLHEDLLDIVFIAIVDCVEESVVSSVLHAETVSGRDGNTLESFIDATPYFSL